MENAETGKKKYQFFGIAIKRVNKTFSVPKDKLDANVNSPVSQCIYHYYAKSTFKNIFAMYSKSNIQSFLILLYLMFSTKT